MSSFIDPTIVFFKIFTGFSISASHIASLLTFQTSVWSVCVFIVCMKHWMFHLGLHTDKNSLSFEEITFWQWSMITQYFRGKMVLLYYSLFIGWATNHLAFRWRQEPAVGQGECHNPERGIDRCSVLFRGCGRGPLVKHHRLNQMLWEKPHLATGGGLGMIMKDNNIGGDLPALKISKCILMWSPWIKLRKGALCVLNQKWNLIKMYVLFSQ